MLVESKTQKWLWRRLLPEKVDKFMNNNNFLVTFFIYLGYLEKTNIPNISSVRSIKYEGDSMKMFKALNFGDGVSIPYKTLKVHNTIRAASPFTSTMNAPSSGSIPKKKRDFYT